MRHFTPYFYVIVLFFLSGVSGQSGDLFTDPVSLEAKRIANHSPSEAITFIDSILLTAEDEDIARIILQKATIMLRAGLYNDVLSTVDTLIAGQNITTSPEIIAEVYLLQSSALHRIAHPDSARFALDTAHKMFLEQDNRRGIARSKRLRAVILSNEGNLSEALNLAFEALETFTETGDESQKSATYSLIGNINFEMGLLSNAGNYMKRALNISLQTGDSLQLIDDYSNLGVAYRKMDSLQIAEAYYLDALAIANRLNVQEDIARLLLNLGSLNHDMDPEKAMSFYTESLRICKQLDIEFGVMLNLTNIGSLKEKNGEYAGAEKDLQEALVLCRQLNQPWSEITIQKNLYDLYRAMDRERDALSHLEKYIELHNNYHDTEQKQHLLDMQIKFELSEKEEEILRLQNRELQNNLLIISTSAAFLLTLFITAAVNYRSRKARQLAEKQHQLAESEKRLLQQNVESKKRELTSLVMRHDGEQRELVAFCDSLRSELTTEKEPDPSRLHRLVENFTAKMSDDSMWSEFNQRFREANSEFTTKLSQLHPDLTPQELRTCYLIRLHLNSKDIAEYLKVSMRTVENHRYAIRKKINLPQGDNLFNYINSL
jgi:tetratricopeptide (TPR) repeat protein